MNVWVVTKANFGLPRLDRNVKIVAVTRTAEDAMKAAQDSLDDDWPQLQWSQNDGRIWMSAQIFDYQFAAELKEVQP